MNLNTLQVNIALIILILIDTPKYSLHETLFAVKLAPNSKLADNIWHSNIKLAQILPMATRQNMQRTDGKNELPCHSIVKTHSSPSCIFI